MGEGALRWARIGVVVALVVSVMAVLPVKLLSYAPPQHAAAASASSRFGVYAGNSNVRTVAALGEAIGQQPNFVMVILNARSWQTLTDPSPLLSRWGGTGYKLIWDVPMLPRTGGATLSEGSTGDYNQYFVTLATSLVAGGQGSSILRLGWDFNWSGHADEFDAYWQQIVTAMRSVRGANFQFEWNPTGPVNAAGNLENYYPGSSYVDLIGLDVFDNAPGSYPGTAAEFTKIETEPYGLNWLATFAAEQGKPVTIPEWGVGPGVSNNGAPVFESGAVTSGGDDPSFINDMAGWMAAHNVYEATLWDVNASRISPTTNPDSFDAVISDFGQTPTLTAPAPTSSTTTSTTSPPTSAAPTTGTPPATQPGTATGSSTSTTVTVAVTPTTTTTTTTTTVTPTTAPTTPETTTTTTTAPTTTPTTPETTTTTTTTGTAPTSTTTTTAPTTTTTTTTTTTSGGGSTTQAQCPCTSAPAMPAAAPSGYSRIFTEDFNTPAPVGDFDNVYGDEFGEYNGGPAGDGSEATYEPNEVLSVANGSLFYDLHTDSSGTAVTAAPQPMNQQGFEYGQVGMAIKLDSETGPQNYKIAFLMWPTSGAWTNEVDFAETQPDFGDDISVNSLLSNDAPNFDMADGNQDTGVNLNDGKYHTFLVTWTPSELTVSIDGITKATFPASSGADPAQEMRVSLQAEGWIPGGDAAISPSSTATVEVPYIYINQYN